jgi:hypothetical protein
MFAVSSVDSLKSRLKIVDNFGAFLGVAINIP